MLEVTKFVSNDTNILAPAKYTFTLNAQDNLPSAISKNFKDYELVIKLPASQYPHFTNFENEIDYTFDNPSSLESDSEAFNHHNYIYIYANYPDLHTISPLMLSLNNITNPEEETSCEVDAEGSPISFEVQYVSRLQGYIYAKSYMAVD
mmetsp:Transcript_24197/g.21297  ORF Transcript_24197/g.21297 Transcript_24197/m.21297 type:complete len:149 (+) Transcript_24197:749-1195(+)